MRLSSVAPRAEAGVRRGRVAEDGVVPERYPVRELPGAGYVERTLENVIDSEGTLIVYAERYDGGTELTAEFCAEHERPLLCLDLAKVTADDAVRQAIEFIRRFGIAVLNVAGPPSEQVAAGAGLDLPTDRGGARRDRPAAPDRAGGVHGGAARFYRWLYPCRGSVAGGQGPFGVFSGSSIGARHSVPRQSQASGRVPPRRSASRAGQAGSVRGYEEAEPIGPESPGGVAPGPEFVRIAAHDERFRRLELPEDAEQHRRVRLREALEYRQAGAQRPRRSFEIFVLTEQVAEVDQRERCNGVARGAALRRRAVWVCGSTVRDRPRRRRTRRRDR